MFILRSCLSLLLAYGLLAFAGGACAESGNMEIYWIDTEGGGATLVIGPTGESMLIDAGFPGHLVEEYYGGDPERDAKRVVEVAKLAGLDKIDSFVLSHYHWDHIGNLPALDRMIQIDKFYDHGDTYSEMDSELYSVYEKVAGDRRNKVKAGDVLPLSGVRVDAVASDGQFIAEPINGGGPNPYCKGAERREPGNPENRRVVGLLIEYGGFTFLNLADFDWAVEMELVCPVNKVGTVSVWLADRHGNGWGAGAPAMLHAIDPQVIMVNNGPRKGMGKVDRRVKSLTYPNEEDLTLAYAYQKFASVPGVEDIWQGHLSVDAPEHNTAAHLIANFEESPECQGHWIKAVVEPSGRYTITNGRNGYSKTYEPR